MNLSSIDEGGLDVTEARWESNCVKGKQSALNL